MVDHICTYSKCARMSDRDTYTNIAYALWTLCGTASSKYKMFDLDLDKIMSYTLLHRQYIGHELTITPSLVLLCILLILLVFLKVKIY